jgi:tetratricopeptide (TPR) repeat protein
VSLPPAGPINGTPPVPATRPLSERERPHRGHRRRRRHAGFFGRLFSRSRHHRRSPSGTRERAVAKRFLPALLTAAVVTSVWGVMFLPLCRSYEVVGEPGGRISVLDYLMARRAASQAAASQAEGDWETALHFARLGVTRDPASRAANRVLLAGFSREGVTPRASDLVEIRTAGRRLLKLAPNDGVDLRLSLRAAMTGADFELVIGRLLPQAPTLEPDLQEMLLDALVRTGRWSEETATVRALLEVPDLPPSLRLYRSAFLAQRGDDPTANAAWEELQRAGTDGAYPAIASRLLIDVAEHRQNLPVMRAALFRLIRQDEDLLHDHLHVWNLMRAEGHDKDVALLIRNRTRQPRTPDELVACLELMGSVGLYTEAQMLEEEAYYSGLDDGRGYLACLLILYRARDAELTTELPLLGADLRSGAFDATTTQVLESLTQGLVADAEKRPQQAQQAYDRLVQAAQTRPDLLLRTAQFLLTLGQPERAGLLASRTESALRGDRAYWGLRQQIALAARNTTELMLASERVVELAPNDRLGLAYLSLSQVLDRRELTDSPDVLRRNLSLHPDRAKRNLYLALAHAWLGQADLALARLKQVPADTLETGDRHLAYFARCEALFQLGEIEECHTLARLLVEDQLFVAQRRWLAGVGLAAEADTEVSEVPRPTLPGLVGKP